MHMRVREIYFILTLWKLAALGQISSFGAEFCVGFMKSPTSTRSFNALIGTNSFSVVNFIVQHSETEIVHHQTSRDSPYRLQFDSGGVSVDSNSFANRNKGICVLTNESTELFVIVYVHLSTETVSASYLALPFQEVLIDLYYEYYVLSTASSDDKKYSGFLLVGLRNNTVISIHPSIPLNIIEDAQKESDNNIEVLPGQSHTVILHRRQTLYISKDGGADVTGTRIVSDKPLTVISGHESGSVPNDGTLEPMAQQIPPTQLWGQRFMIVPFKGDLGQIIKIISSANNTEIVYNCYKFHNKTMLNAGGIHQFFVTFDDYCYIEANSSVLVGQFHYSSDENTKGDTTMILVASFDQYLNDFTFWTLNTSTASDQMTHYISVVVPSEHFNHTTTSILYDGSPIENEWKPIFNLNNKTIIGYGCAVEVSRGQHQVSHTDPTCRLFVTVYAFTETSISPRAYGYPVGMFFSTSRALGVYFLSDDHIVHEREGSIALQMYRLTTENTTYKFHFKTENCTDSLNSDYIPTCVDIVFSPMDYLRSISITIKDDNLTETNETFIVQLCHVSQPLNNVCIQSKVTIVDDDYLTIGITEMQYNSSQGLTIKVKILKGEPSPEYSITSKLSITLVTTDGNQSFFDNAVLSSLYPTVLKEYGIGNIAKLDSKILRMVISELSVDIGQPVIIDNPGVCKMDIQGTPVTMSCFINSSSAGFTVTTSTTGFGSSPASIITVFSSLKDMTGSPTTSLTSITATIFSTQNTTADTSGFGMTLPSSSKIMTGSPTTSLTSITTAIFSTQNTTTDTSGFGMTLPSSSKIMTGSPTTSLTSLTATIFSTQNTTTNKTSFSSSLASITTVLGSSRVMTDSLTTFKTSFAMLTFSTHSTTISTSSTMANNTEVRTGIVTYKISTSKFTMTSITTTFAPSFSGLMSSLSPSSTSKPVNSFSLQSFFPPVSVSHSLYQSLSSDNKQSLSQVYVISGAVSFLLLGGITVMSAIIMLVMCYKRKKHQLPQAHPSSRECHCPDQSWSFQPGIEDDTKTDDDDTLRLKLDDDNPPIDDDTLRFKSNVNPFIDDDTLKFKSNDDSLIDDDTLKLKSNDNPLIDDDSLKIKDTEL